MNAEQITQECLQYISNAMKPGSNLAKAFATVRGGGSHKDVYAASELLAAKTSEALIACIPETAFADAELYGKIGTEIVAKVLRGGHTELVDLAAVREAAKLKELGVGLKPIKTAANEVRVYDIASKFNKAIDHKEFLELAGGKTLPQFYGATLDEFCQGNAQFQYEAGITATLVRTSGRESCDFCTQLCALTPIEYDGTAECGTGQNLFARHSGCTCAIDVRARRGAAFARVNNYKTARR